MKRNIGIIFGGASSEYEVSLMSSTSVLENIDRELFAVHCVGINKNGDMFYYTGECSKILNNTWENSGETTPCVISPVPSHHGLLLLDGKNTIVKLDAVFPVLHGKNGEDGTIQGLLTMAQIPYVGCKTLASSACMDKVVTRTLLDNVGIKSTRWLSIIQSDFVDKKDDFIKDVAEKLGFPCFVKPSNAGSSVGITKVDKLEQLDSAITLAFSHDYKLLVEAAVVGRELEVAVLGNESPIASCIGEILPTTWYDYDAKYIDGSTNTQAPAELDEKIAKEIQETAVKAYKTMGCSGLSRVDFFLNEQNEVILNEINTIPGFTKISMYPQLFIKSGLSYSKLITRLIDLANY